MLTVTGPSNMLFNVKMSNEVNLWLLTYYLLVIMTTYHHWIKSLPTTDKYLLCDDKLWKTYHIQITNVKYVIAHDYTCILFKLKQQLTIRVIINGWRTMTTDIIILITKNIMKHWQVDCIIGLRTTQVTSLSQRRH